MSYQSLARKYRPSNFDDMVGQDASTKALSNAIRLQRIPSGVIFSGVRGIGKTTTARLFAKALNCDQGPTDQPCNQCPSCAAITEGIHEDVLEIDGASNTSVDDVRALQETVAYVPQRSRYKVYIVDEVHMLSQSAFNALLKTLEEPPEHVLFIFATTELQKIPETIISRCQTFHLKRLSLATIKDRLVQILQEEGISFEDPALTTIARQGRGSMRDALTFLDQVIALGDGAVTKDSLLGLVNSGSSESYIAFIASLVARDGQQVVTSVEQWAERGLAFDEISEELAKYCRHGFVLRDLGADGLDASLLGLANSELEILQEVASSAPALDLNRIFRFLVKCRKDLEGSDLDRFIFENYCLEWCFDPGLPSIDELRKATRGGAVSTAATTSQPQRAQGEARSPGSNLKQRWQKALGGAEPDKKEPASHQPAPEPAAAKATVEAVPPTPVNAGLGETSQEAQPRDRNPEPSPQPADARPGASAAQEPRGKAAGSEGPSLRDIAKLAGQNHELHAPEPVEPVNESQSSHPFPASWKELVDVWKAKKPLGGRVLEETIPLDYSETLIRIAVDPASMAGTKLLHGDHKKRILDSIREIFGFTGELVVENQSEPRLQQAADGPDSLLNVRKQEEQAARDSLFEELREHPITKEALAVFGGSIKEIEVQDI